MNKILKNIYVMSKMKRNKEKKEIRITKGLNRFVKFLNGHWSHFISNSLNFNLEFFSLSVSF